MLQTAGDRPLFSKCLSENKALPTCDSALMTRFGQTHSRLKLARARCSVDSTLWIIRFVGIFDFTAEFSLQFFNGRQASLQFLRKAFGEPVL